MFGVIENISFMLPCHLQFSYTNIHLIPKGCNLSYSTPLFFSQPLSLFLGSVLSIFHHSSQGPLLQAVLLAFRCSRQLPSSAASRRAWPCLTWEELHQHQFPGLTGTKRRLYSLFSPSRNLGQLGTKDIMCLQVKSPLMSVRMTYPSTHVISLVFPGPPKKSKPEDCQETQNPYQKPSEKGYQKLLLNNFDLHSSS